MGFFVECPSPPWLCTQEGSLGLSPTALLDVWGSSANGGNLCDVFPSQTWHRHFF